MNSPFAQAWNHKGKVLSNLNRFNESYNLPNKSLQGYRAGPEIRRSMGGQREALKRFSGILKPIRPSPKPKSRDTSRMTFKPFLECLLNPLSYFIPHSPKRLKPRFAFVSCRIVEAFVDLLFCSGKERTGLLCTITNRKPPNRT